MANQSWTLATATISSAAASGATGVLVGSVANIAVEQFPAPASRLG